MIVRRPLALLIVAAVSVTACGTDDGQDADRTNTEPSAESSPEASAETELMVLLDRGDGSAAEEWTLTCEPAGGTHPDPEAACDSLDGLDPEVFEPVPPDTACTMIHGGPQTASVSGHWNGEPVDAEFSRENGCEIARWDAAIAVLGDEGGVTA